MKPKVLFIAGPTGAGKSEAALSLALSLNAEIISADSMQVYRGMDVGTAKPSREEQGKVPHHLIDILAPSELFSVHEFRERALDCLREISARGRLPMVVGGTGLYIRALLEGLSGQPGGSEEIRERLSLETERCGLLSLYERLAEADPQAASAIKPTDQKRIIRALEILEISGKTPTEWYQSKQPLTEAGFEPVIVGLTRPREALYAAIDRRVERMFENGLPDEVRQLAKLPLSRTALQAVGYKELLEMLGPETGWSEKNILEAKAKIKLNTRHLAKRQMTWFRREKGIRWVLWDEKESTACICGKILSCLPA